MSEFLSFLNKATGASNVLHNIVALETTRKQHLMSPVVEGFEPSLNLIAYCGHSRG